MIDHVVLNVTDLEACRRFYESTLATLGYEVVMSFPTGVGFGVRGKPDFWIAAREPVQTGAHVAFTCDDRDTVGRFFAAALAAGGRDNGAPGIREQYHPNYYAAFVLDPQGNNVEAVCHAVA